MKKRTEEILECIAAFRKVGVADSSITGIIIALIQTQPISTEASV